MDSNISFARAGMTGIGLVAILPFCASAGVILGPPILLAKSPRKFVTFVVPSMLISPNLTVATLAIGCGIGASAYVVKKECLYQEMNPLSKKAIYSGTMMGAATMAAISLRNIRAAYPFGCLVAGVVTCATLHLLIEKEKNLKAATDRLN